jgi:hypothetical protein
MISHPPQLNGYQLTHSVVLRFIANAAFDATITIQNLLDTWLFAQTAVLGNQVFRSVKVRSVEAWAAPLLGSAVSLQVAFNGTTAGSIGDQIVHEDTSMGIQPAHVRAVPSKRSLAADFQLSAASNAFRLAVPSGAVVDVALTFKGVFNNAVAAQNALVGATPGAVYLRGLDGVAAATTVLVPAAEGSSIV